MAAVAIEDRDPSFSFKDAELTHPIFKETEPRRIREIIRGGEWTRSMKGIGLGYTHAGLAILPRSEALEFLIFCQRNPKPCSVLEVTETGDPEPKLAAPGADLRTDLPKYHVFRHGELVDEVTDIRSYWREDLVAFLLGCANTFEAALLAADVPLRALEEKRGPAMYRSNIPCRPAGKFRGPMVVAMRPMSPAWAIRAIQVTSRFPNTHGAPIHMGDPAAIGIQDVDRPDWGSSLTIKPGEVPLFWACSLTPHVVALEARVEIMITQAPGHVFLTDLKDESLTVA